MQKLHQTSPHAAELNSFLIISFVISFLFSFLLALVFMKKEKLPLIEKSAKGGADWLILVIAVVSGVCVAANHKLNLGLSGVIPTAVFFPVVNGGNLVLTTLSALVIFREKLTKRQWIGVVLGTASVLFLCMPTEAIFSFALKG